MFWRVHYSDLPPFGAENAYSALWSDPARICRACDGRGRKLVRAPRVDPCPGCGHLPSIRQGCDQCGHYPDGSLMRGFVITQPAVLGGTCRRCGGSGIDPDWLSGKTRQRGYSCCEDPEDLVRYFEARGGLPDDTPVVCFSGRVLRGGSDTGEVLVIPAERPRPRWFTWAWLRRAVENRRARALNGRR